MDHDRDAAPLSLGDQVADGLFPPHHPGCFGCGPANPASPHIVFGRYGDTVRGTFTMDERHQGAPGVAHGGIVAAALDDACGAILVPLRQPAVTVKLDVTFRTPARLHRDYVVTAVLAAREGRKLFIDTTLTDGDTVIATGRAIFVAVDTEHFLSLGATPGDMSSIGV
ncbi:PaaI family thioesterase [Nocardia seriolae]|uniref:Acyl-coenzyme A thioesterase THEM4 n=1 Tax=Nocardia seriolae TaxID=37332 RepID=A0A0B8N218_9NOCA|nr:PaaI family thioesterase [Nocardia seriolae]APB01137.1 hypothetical protein NS506_07112 [Nocardia seriolae]MTJ61359.1 PaaI family thioesterase [Nocardia seriolae]MTJ75408.1 PaaI family thioesterase [Nocardia seriolae]MTJ90518.1 PaaI family thioesterase [Nocardia seriolae]MTK34478.1 PaaI family thioesterase [Nocardia seriolae]